MSIALILVLILCVIAITYQIWLWLVVNQERANQKSAEQTVFEFEDGDGEKAFLFTGFFTTEQKGQEEVKDNVNSTGKT